MRARKGLYAWKRDEGLTAAAHASASAQANRGRMGHCGTMPSGSAEGVGYGRVDPFKFNTCYLWSRKHTYAGAAIVGRYAALSLDIDTSRGEIGSGGGRGFSKRRGRGKQRRANRQNRRRNRRRG